MGGGPIKEPDARWLHVSARAIITSRHVTGPNIQPIYELIYYVQYNRFISSILKGVSVVKLSIN